MKRIPIDTSNCRECGEYFHAGEDICIWGNAWQTADGPLVLAPIGHYHTECLNLVFRRDIARGR